MSMQVDFPLQKGSLGYFQVVEDAESIRGRLIQLLKTSPGERVGVPSFGVGIDQFLYAPMDMITASDIKAAISRQMSVFEPFLQILSISVYGEYVTQPPVCHVIMTLRNRRTQEELSFDFNIKYRNPIIR